MGQLDQGVQGPGQSMTKLGKFLYILKGMGTGALIGATQPTPGQGYLAAQENQNQQQRFQAEQQQRQLQNQVTQQSIAQMPWEIAHKRAMYPLEEQEAQSKLTGIPPGTRVTRDANGNWVQQGYDVQGRAVGPATPYFSPKGRTPVQIIDPNDKAGLANNYPSPGFPLKTAWEDKFLNQTFDENGDAIANPVKFNAQMYNKNTPQAGSTSAEEAEYLRTETKRNSGKQLTKDETAFNKAYRDMKLLAPTYAAQQLQTGGGTIPSGGGGAAATPNAPAAPNAPARPAPKNAPDGWVSEKGETLNSVPANIRGQVRKILAYRDADPASTGSSRNPLVTGINYWVNQLDPQHDKTTFPARNQILGQMESDANTGQIGSINTGLGHIGDLYRASQALAQHDLPVLQRIASAWGIATGGTAETLYESIVHKVGPEIANAYVKGGGTQGERGTNEDDFALSKGIGQIQNNIYESANLFNSKLASKRQSWQTTFRPYRPQDQFDERFLTPEAKRTMKELAPRSPVADKQNTSPPTNKPTFGVRVQ
jgi:hypothetical protein